MTIVRRVRIQGQWTSWSAESACSVPWIVKGLTLNKTLVVSFKRPDGNVYQYKVVQP